MSLIALAPRHSAREELIPVNDSTWRVVDRSGRALGHVVTESTPRGERFRSRRFHAPTRSTVDFGAYWSIEDACASLR